LIHLSSRDMLPLMNRMKLWRTKKKSQETGLLTQICVWAPVAEAELARKICARVAEPTERGEKFRNHLFQQLERRRTIYHEWQGFSTHVEIDAPLAGPHWFLKNIGGRIIGPVRTHVELSPQEADELKDRLHRCCQDEIEAWLKAKDLFDRVRDHTGVVTGPTAPEDPHRPDNDAAFAANEARIAKAITEWAFASRKPPVSDPSIVQYEGIAGYPSFCQVVHRRQGNRVHFAVVHMPNGGTTPTNMIESLATFLRQKFYSDVEAGDIDWFDVRPPETYFTRELNITSVMMQHANGVYSDPEWDDVTDNVSPDWRAMIEETISKARAAC
jgi:hypothetical protein